MGINEKCCICGNKNCTVGSYKDIFNYLVFNCEHCGKYILPISSPYLTNIVPAEVNKSKVWEFLFFNKKKGRTYFIGEIKDFSKFLDTDPSAKLILITSDQINSWYPRNFSQMIDLSLLYFYENQEFLGENKEYSFYELTKVFFIEDAHCEEERAPQKYVNRISYFTSYLNDIGYIKRFSASAINDFRWSHKVTITITPAGLEKCYDLQKNGNKDVFVAMSFHKSAEDIRAAIKQGIDNAQYSSLLMDEIVHNHQIVPEMMRLIKESRLMIMDITYPNFGAYYEAGYAQGLGKEVIITCKREVWDQKKFVCEKDDNCRYIEIASKPHFDIVQKQILVWDDYDDLTKKLAEWIKHLVG